MFAYFLLMKLTGYATVVEFRFLNFFIMFFCLRSFLLRLKKENNGNLEYLHSLAYGFFVAALTSVIFSAMIFIYLAVADHGLLEHLQLNQPFGEYLTPGSAAIVLVLEGCSSGAIVAFALVQFMSRDSATKEG
jgi:hypothetical protein